MTQRKWYVLGVSGEGVNRFVCDLSKEEHEAIGRIIVAQRNGYKTDYCGYFGFEAGPFETEEEARRYITEHFWYDYEGENENVFIAPEEEFDYYMNIIDEMKES